VLAQQQVLNKQITAAGETVTVRAAVAAASVDVARLEPASRTRRSGPRSHRGRRPGSTRPAGLRAGGRAGRGGGEANRIVELLLTAIKPAQLITGKVIGIGAAGLLQLVGVGRRRGGGRARGDVLTLPTSVATSVAGLGGDLVPGGIRALRVRLRGERRPGVRQEDVGGVTIPVMMFIIIPYIMEFRFFRPTRTTVSWPCSPHPFFAPTLMPVRIALGFGTEWQMWLSLGLWRSRPRSGSPGWPGGSTATRCCVPARR